ncbi:MAG: acyl-[acyl-carrier-protein]--UDP-N-acetylglucosamine O-acyltransferase, partial [Candidatus Kapabacteria bacterium]|nr:acyl-[acyl-carrier-protein]--UDP-N-acetylglucosamine O-acyltransferase [Candidatus Kapabacteria bacterium]
MIHSTAIVSEKAKIGINVKIGPYCVINDDVEIGDETQLFSNVVLDNGTRLGSECKIFSGAVIGTAPQDLKYDGETTYAIIGNRTVVREYATINRATVATGKTTIGDDCLVMAYSH